MYKVLLAFEHLHLALKTPLVCTVCTALGVSPKASLGHLVTPSE